MDRRTFLKQGSMAASLPLALSASGCSTTASKMAETPHVKRVPGTLSWVDGNAPDYQSGATWGYPWTGQPHTFTQK